MFVRFSVPSVSVISFVSLSTRDYGDFKGAQQKASKVKQVPECQEKKRVVFFSSTNKMPQSYYQSRSEYTI